MSSSSHGGAWASGGTEWLVPAVISYVALAGWIYWGNKNVRFVPFEQPGDEEGDG